MRAIQSSQASLPGARPFQWRDQVFFRRILPVLCIWLWLGSGSVFAQSDPVFVQSDSAFAQADAVAPGAEKGDWGSALYRMAQAGAGNHRGLSGFYILDTGQEALLQRAALIEAAEHSIDAQYYIWNSDISGRYLARRLVLAADRGVRVRLLLDDINIARRDHILAILDHHPNIDVRIFNPSPARNGRGKWLIFAAEFERLNRRMHNKTFVVDGALGIVGGRNIGDEYFDLHPAANFRDRDALAAGPIVRDFSANFDVYWNSKWTYPITRLYSGKISEQEFAEQGALARNLAGDTSGLTRIPPGDRGAALAVASETLQQLTWAAAELIFDPPVEDMAQSSDQPKGTALALRRLVEAARSEILIESAYLVLADSQLDRIDELKARGVRIAALTNSLASNDVVSNHAAYARWRPAMLEHGMELHELRPDAAACRTWISPATFCATGAVALHAKSAVFDRQTVYIGSFNVNLRSIYLNGETVLIIYSEALAKRVAGDIETGMALENSWQVSRNSHGKLRWISSAEDISTREPASAWWRRVRSGMIARLAVEKYL